MGPLGTGTQGSKKPKWRGSSSKGDQGFTVGRPASLPFHGFALQVAVPAFFGSRRSFHLNRPLSFSAVPFSTNQPGLTAQSDVPLLLDRPGAPL
jgi:hypothetical protein